MIIELSRLVGRLDPRKTVLFFGSGSSIPSGGDSGPGLASKLAERFHVEGSGYTLTEISQIASNREGRPRLVSFVREQLDKLTPTGGILNVPIYDWNGLYTTNYDEILEKSYKKVGKSLRVIASNFDFGKGRDDGSARLYKVYGTIGADIVDGINSRLIITDEDYDLTDEYREMVWNRLRSDLAENDCVIIGHSLEDSHIKELITRIASLKQDSGHQTNVYLLMYQPDPNRAALYTRRNMIVAFGGIDDFFAEISKTDQGSLDIEASDEIFGDIRALYPATTMVGEAVQRETTFERMYNGWPASWADVAASLTFPRDVALQSSERLLSSGELFAMLLGASGTGKTTAARQAVLDLKNHGYVAWEHNGDRELLVKEWLQVAKKLQKADRQGVLLIDDAHEHLTQINQLADSLAGNSISNLQFVLASARHDWNPRVKSGVLYKCGTEYILGRLSDQKLKL